MRIDLEDAGDRADTDSLSQSGNGPYQLVRINRLGVKRRPHGFEELATATETHEFAPASSMGMTVGAELPAVDPAGIGARGLRAELTRRVDMAAATSGDDHAGR